MDRIPLQRAVLRGELTADTDIDFAVGQLVGPIYYRVLVTGEAMDNKFRNSLVSAFLSRVNPQVKAAR
jgi:hypothetical protein